MSSNILNQFRSECKEALNYTPKVRKTFEKVFTDTMPLYLSILGRINFLQLRRYGRFSEQTYRNNFESNEIDWLAFNFNASLTSVNLAKTAYKINGHTTIHLLKRFICVFGIDPNPYLIDKLLKELLSFAVTTA